MAIEERIKTLHPDKGKQGPNIARWKYDLVRQAILQILPSRGEGFSLSELPVALRRVIGKKERDRLGSLSWYMITVKLDLEARGLVERVPGSQPQRLRKNA